MKCKFEDIVDFNHSCIYHLPIRVWNVNIRTILKLIALPARIYGIIKFGLPNTYSELFQSFIRRLSLFQLKYKFIKQCVYFSFLKAELEQTHCYVMKSHKLLIFFVVHCS